MDLPVSAFQVLGLRVCTTHLTKIFKLYVYEYAMCAHMHLRRPEDPLELELQVFMSFPVWVLETKLMSPERSRALPSALSLQSLVLVLWFHVAQAVLELSLYLRMIPYLYLLSAEIIGVHHLVCPELLITYF